MDAETLARLQMALDDQNMMIEDLQMRLETAAMMAEMDAEPVEDANPIQIFGFLDFGYDQWFKRAKTIDQLSFLRPDDAGTFVFGNLNVILDAEPAAGWHAVAEIRYLLAPHGEDL